MPLYEWQSGGYDTNGNVLAYTDTVSEPIRHTNA
jgi:hypothetical protein